MRRIASQWSFPRKKAHLPSLTPSYIQKVNLFNSYLTIFKKILQNTASEILSFSCKPQPELLLWLPELHPESSRSMNLSLCEAPAWENTSFATTYTKREIGRASCRERV